MGYPYTEPSDNTRTSVDPRVRAVQQGDAWKTKQAELEKANIDYYRATHPYSSPFRGFDPRTDDEIRTSMLHERNSQINMARQGEIRQGKTPEEEREAQLAENLYYLNKYNNFFGTNPMLMSVDWARNNPEYMWSLTRENALQLPYALTAGFMMSPGGGLTETFLNAAKSGFRTSGNIATKLATGASNLARGVTQLSRQPAFLANVAMNYVPTAMALGDMYVNGPNATNVTLATLGASNPIFKVGGEGMRAATNAYNSFRLNRTLSRSLDQNPIFQIRASNPAYLDTGSIFDQLSYLDQVFPNSKIRGVQWHGGNITDASQIGPFRIDPDAGAMYGFYTSPSRKYASRYGETKPVLLNIENPLNTTGRWTGVLDQPTVQGVTNSGYDGIINSRFNSNPLHPANPENITFNPEQVHILGSNSDLAGFRSYQQLKPGNNAQFLEETKSNISATPTYDSSNSQPLIYNLNTKKYEGLQPNEYYEDMANQLNAYAEDYYESVTRPLSKDLGIKIPRSLYFFRRNRPVKISDKLILDGETARVGLGLHFNTGSEVPQSLRGLNFVSPEGDMFSNTIHEAVSHGTDPNMPQKIWDRIDKFTQRIGYSRKKDKNEEFRASAINELRSALIQKGYLKKVDGKYDLSAIDNIPNDVIWNTLSDIEGMAAGVVYSMKKLSDAERSKAILDLKDLLKTVPIGLGVIATGTQSNK